MVESGLRQIGIDVYILTLKTYALFVFYYIHYNAFYSAARHSKFHR